MSGTSSAIEIYGKLAAAQLDSTRQAGRYGFQAEAERGIIADILPKLALNPNDDFLEIGCGPGALLVPISLRVASATGVDHPDVVARVAEENPNLNICLVGGQFPNVPLKPDYDKILIYSVVHYLADLDEVIGFILTAARLLTPNGRLLIGDLPNKSRGNRFRATNLGKEIDKSWAQLRDTESSTKAAKDMQIMQNLRQKGNFTDLEILAILSQVRAAGFRAYNLPQNPNLPFGRSREDILIINDRDNQ